MIHAFLKTTSSSPRKPIHPFTSASSPPPLLPASSPFPPLLPLPASLAPPLAPPPPAPAPRSTGVPDCRPTRPAETTTGTPPPPYTIAVRRTRCLLPQVRLPRYHSSSGAATSNLPTKTWLASGNADSSAPPVRGPDRCNAGGGGPDRNGRGARGAWVVGKNPDITGRWRMESSGYNRSDLRSASSSATF